MTLNNKYFLVKSCIFLRKFIPSNIIFTQIGLPLFQPSKSLAIRINLFGEIGILIIDLFMVPLYLQVFHCVSVFLKRIFIVVSLTHP